MTNHHILLRILIDVTTVASGKDFCCARVMGWVILLFGCAMTGYNTIVLHQPFNCGPFFTAVAWLPPAVGGAIWMKKSDEPTSAND